MGDKEIREEVGHPTGPEGYPGESEVSGTPAEFVLGAVGWKTMSSVFSTLSPSV